MRNEGIFQRSRVVGKSSITFQSFCLWEISLHTSQSIERYRTSVRMRRTHCSSLLRSAKANMWVLDHKTHRILITS